MGRPFASLGVTVVRLTGVPGFETDEDEDEAVGVGVVGVDEPSTSGTVSSSVLEFSIGGGDGTPLPLEGRGDVPLVNGDAAPEVVLAEVGEAMGGVDGVVGALKTRGLNRSRRADNGFTVP